MHANLSRVVESGFNHTANALMALEEQHTSLAKVVVRNRMALDLMFAAKGRVCAVLNQSCGTCVSRHSAIIHAVNELRKDAQSLQYMRWKLL